MYVYPQALIDYLTEEEAEGKEIFITQIHDGTAFIIPQFNEWIVYITWYKGDETYSLVNICGKAYKRLSKIMCEMEMYTS
jgi:hypothetical protein